MKGKQERQHTDARCLDLTCKSSDMSARPSLLHLFTREMPSTSTSATVSTAYDSRRSRTCRRGQGLKTRGARRHWHDPSEADQPHTFNVTLTSVHKLCSYYQNYLGDKSKCYKICTSPRALSESYLGLQAHGGVCVEPTCGVTPDRAIRCMKRRNSPIKSST